MGPFKRPLIITGITLLAALLIGIGCVTWIHHSNISNRKKEARAEMLGNGLGIISLVIITPFWIGAAARVGKERRERRQSSSRLDPPL